MKTQADGRVAPGIDNAAHAMYTENNNALDLPNLVVDTGCTQIICFGRNSHNESNANYVCSIKTRD